MKILPLLWSYGAGLGSGYIVWIAAVHAELSCPQKSIILLFSLLTLVMSLLAMTLVSETRR